MKNRLIRQWADMWPREVCDFPSLDRKKLYIRTFDYPGVYILYREDIPYYVGQAQHLGERVWVHANNPEDRYYNFWNMVSMFVVKDKKLIDDLEAILIAAMPTANASEPRMRRMSLPKHVRDTIRRARKLRATASH